MRKRRTKKECREMRIRIKNLIKAGFGYKEIAEIFKLNSPQAVYYHYEKIHHSKK